MEVSHNTTCERMRLLGLVLSLVLLEGSRCDIFVEAESQHDKGHDFP